MVKAHVVLANVFYKRVSFSQFLFKRKLQHARRFGPKDLAPHHQFNNKQIIKTEEIDQM